MTANADDLRRKKLAAAFQMPSVQTMVSRKSSITNAFVNSIIPSIRPSLEQIERALTILEMDPSDVRRAYCGDKSSEWDHLRPLVLRHRPTGYISEIANLVPACGKCNQSKGNKPWRDWILSAAPRSPTGRGIANVEYRVARLEAYEQWLTPKIVDFESILGHDTWEKYWLLRAGLVAQMRRCQEEANSLRAQIVGAIEEE